MRRHDLVPQHAAQPLPLDALLSALVTRNEREGVDALSRLHIAYALSSTGMHNARALSQQADESFKASPMNETGYRAIVDTHNILVVNLLQAYGMGGRS